jgi:hypothetical protein
MGHLSNLSRVFSSGPIATTKATSSVSIDQSIVIVRVVAFSPQSEMTNETCLTGKSPNNRTSFDPVVGSGQDPTPAPRTKHQKNERKREPRAVAPWTDDNGHGRLPSVRPFAVIVLVIIVVVEKTGILGTGDLFLYSP